MQFNLLTLFINISALINQKQQAIQRNYNDNKTQNTTEYLRRQQQQQQLMPLNRQYNHSP